MIKKIGIVFFSLLFTLFAIPFFIDVNSYKIPLLTFIHEQTGIVAHIDGDLKLSLLPSPHLNINNITVEDQKSSTNKPKAIGKLKQLSLSVEWLPLFNKTLHIHHIDLLEPILYLEKETNGTLNVSALTAKSSLAPAPVSSPEPRKIAPINDEQMIRLTIAKATIANGTVIYNDIRTNKKTEITNINIDGAFNPTHGLEVKGKATAENHTIMINIKGGTFIRNLPSILEATINLDTADESKGLHGTISVNATQKDSIITSTIASNALKIPFQFTLGDQIINLEKGLKFSANLTASDKKIDLTAFKTIIDTMALSGKGSFDIEKNRALASAALSSQSINAMATFDTDVSKDRPYISAHINIPTLNQSKGNVKQQSKPHTQTNNKENTPTERWSKEAIDLSALQSIDGDLAVSIGTFTWSDIKLTQTKLTLKLMNGVASILTATSQAFGGNIKAEGIINTNLHNFSIKTSLSDINTAMLPGVKGSPLKAGQLHANAAITSKTSSINHLINHLSGTLKIDMPNTVVEGFDIKQCVADLKQANDISSINTLKASFDRKKDMHIHKIHGDFTLTNGVAKTTNFECDTNEGNVISTGDINVPKWTLDITSKIKVHNFNKIPYITVQTKGSIDQPDFSLDMGQLQQFLVKAVANQLVEKAKKKVKNELKEKAQSQIKEKVGNEIAKKLGNLLPGLLGG